MSEFREQFIDATVVMLLQIELPKILELLTLSERFPGLNELDRCISEIRSTFSGLTQILEIVVAPSDTETEALSSPTNSSASMDLLVHQLVARLQRLPPLMLEKHVQVASGAPSLLELIMNTIMKVAEVLGQAAAIGEHLPSRR
jgi:hypothetical protein